MAKRFPIDSFLKEQQRMRMRRLITNTLAERRKKGKNEYVFG